MNATETVEVHRESRIERRVRLRRAARLRRRQMDLTPVAMREARKQDWQREQQVRIKLQRKPGQVVTLPKSGHRYVAGRGGMLMREETAKRLQDVRAQNRRAQ